MWVIMILFCLVHDVNSSIIRKFFKEKKKHNDLVWITALNHGDDKRLLRSVLGIRQIKRDNYHLPFSTHRHEIQGRMTVEQWKRPSWL